MKLEVGMYIRFDYHRISVPIQIGKITEVHYDEDEKYYFYLTDNGLVIGEDNLVKEPSHNIMDLMEVGDYVNGEKVFEVLIDRNMSRVKTELSTFFESDIESIVTKEQFDSISYKVGE